MTDNITIARKEYDQLLKDSNKLFYLESYGVDNWEGYDIAINAMYEEGDNNE